MDLIDLIIFAQSLKAIFRFASEIGGMNVSNGRPGGICKAQFISEKSVSVGI